MTPDQKIRILQKLDDILATIEGMRMDNEGIRRNVSSNADHHEAQLRVLVNEVRQLRAELK